MWVAYLLPTPHSAKRKKTYIEPLPLRQAKVRASCRHGRSGRADHRFIKKRITASLGFRSADGAWRTIEGYEAMHAIRKGQVRWVGKADPVAQRQFIHTIFGIAA